MRNDSYFDSHLVEGGPPPLPLADGNYLYIYNSARCALVVGSFFFSPPTQGTRFRNDNNSGNGLQYNIGWAILNGANPSQILQRCNEPLLSPTTGWEVRCLSSHIPLLLSLTLSQIGTAPWLGLTPNVVFCEGMSVGEQADTFVIYYGGADSVLGAAEVRVTYG